MFPFSVNLIGETRYYRRCIGGGCFQGNCTVISERFVISIWHWKLGVYHSGGLEAYGMHSLASFVLQHYHIPITFRSAA